MRLENAWESWAIDLRSRNLSYRTLETYKLAVDQLGDWMKQRGHSLDVTQITSRDLREFIGRMLDTRSATTANQRYRSLRGLFKFLLAEGEIETDPLDKVTRPKIAEKQIEVVSEPQLKALLDTCDPFDFRGRRDTAIIMLMWDTGLRISELTGLKVEDVSLALEVCWVDGKSGPRQVPFTIITTRAIDRYLRIRSKQRSAHLSDLWLTSRGGGKTRTLVMTRSGVAQMLRRRSEQASTGHLHAHMFRHAAADRFLSAGMDEGSVMELLGWSDRSQLDRYGRSVRHRRAIDSYRKLIH